MREHFLSPHRSFAPAKISNPGAQRSSYDANHAPAPKQMRYFSRRAPDQILYPMRTNTSSAPVRLKFKLPKLPKIPLNFEI